ncbi:hypothetical protein EON81_16095 [bacterium]|nr:MAG: hypothetical protein EON81_16095 [bacterium]
MSKRTNRSNGPRNGTVLLTGIFAALGVGAMATYMAKTPEAMKVAPEVRREESDKPTKTPAQEPQSVVAPKPVGGEFRLPIVKDDTIVLDEKPISTNTPIKAVAEASLQAAGIEDVRLLGARMSRGTIVLDFSSKLIDGVGSMQEGRFIDALTQGMRQVKGAERISLFSDGKPIETLGHIQWGESISLKEGEEPQP